MVHTIPPPLQLQVFPNPIEEKLTALSMLPDNWDSYGASPLSETVLLNGRKALHQLTPKHVDLLDPQDIYPYPHGTLAFAWQSPTSEYAELILEIGKKQCSFLVEYPGGHEDGRELFSLDDGIAWEHLVKALDKLLQA